jgi:hypothetical protein
MRQVERVAERLQKQRPPSDARIEDLDAPPVPADHGGPAGGSSK